MSRSPHWQQRWQSLLTRLHLVYDASAEQRLLEQLSSPERCTVVGFVNAHAFNLSAGNADYH